MSDKVRVYEIAEEAGVSIADVIAKAKNLGIIVKNSQSAVSYEDAEEITKYIMTGNSSRLEKIRVYEIAEKAEISSQDVIAIAKDLGIDLKSPQSALSYENAERIKNYISTSKSSRLVKKPKLKKITISKPIKKTEYIPIDELIAMKVNEIALETQVTPEQVIIYAKDIGYTKAKHPNTSIPIEIAKKLITYIETKTNTYKEKITSDEQQIKSLNIDSNDYKDENKLKNNENKELFSSKKIDYKFEYKNILFKGVPGTGKSKTIDKIIEKHLKLKNNHENILRINIHSSSSNSDLMQGIGINSDEGAIQYKEKQGLILNFIQKATFCPLQPFALILEEIQENSLNELIGDLIYLIEDSKRTKIVLADDKEYTCEELIEKFKKDKVEINSVKIPNLVSQNNIYKTMILPDNLFIFCTSNYRDDKKVIEDNLLRRFDVIEIYPKYKKELGDDFINQIISNFLENLNESILNFCSEKGEIHPDRFMIGHSIWLKVDNKQDFERTFLKVITEFKDVKDFHFDDFKEIIKDIEFPFDIEQDYTTYQAWINNLQKNCYDFLEYK